MNWQRDNSLSPSGRGTYFEFIHGFCLPRRRSKMNWRVFASMGLLISVTLLLEARAQTPPAVSDKTVAASKGWTAPKTPWGDPDLQGIWTSDDCIGTPMQRPANIGERLYLTELEIAERETQLARQTENDKQEFLAADTRAGVGPPPHWGERARRPCKQTSLVVDPPNGRIPDLTAKARTRRIPEGAGNNNPRPASWEDFSYYIRCIPRGVRGSFFPVISGNGAQIIQAPGFVRILHEMVHEARVIPLNGPHASRNIGPYMGVSRGHRPGSR